MLRRLDHWLERTGRKLVIRNSLDGTPTLLRYSLFPTKTSPTAPSREPRWGNIYIHKFLQSEEFDLHDHPWPFVSFLLSGTYREHLPNNQTRVRKAGSIAFFPARWTHNVELEPTKTCWTLVIRGKHQRQWGCHTSTGWVAAREYLAQVKSGNSKRIESVSRTVSGPVVQDRWEEQPKRVLLIGDDGLVCPHMAEHFMDYHPNTELIVMSRGADTKRLQDSCRFVREPINSNHR